MEDVENPWTVFAVRSRRVVLPAILALALSPAAAAPFVLCDHGRPKAACVVDGDTFWIHGEKVRPESYEAPEMGEPKCAVGGPLGRQSRDALLVILNSGQVAIERHGKDKYGRTLAIVTVDGREIGVLLMAEGLARPYVPGAPAWCD